MPLDEIRLLPSQAWRRLLWTLLTYPDTFGFPYGTLVTGLCTTMTVISCLPFITEYDLSFDRFIRALHTHCRVIPTVTELKQLEAALGVERIYFPLYSRSSYQLEIICLVAFSVEWILRILSAPTFVLILNDVFNYLDAVSLTLIPHPHTSSLLPARLSLYPVLRA